jgi:hypothetical protein
MIHIERIALPDGLRALAHRDVHGNLVIYVSQGLDAASQRAAVMEAVRALRRNRWQAGVPTAGIAVLLAFRSLAARAARVLRVHPAAWGSAAAVAVAGAATAGFFLVTAPHPHNPAASGGRPGPVPSAVVPSRLPGQQPAPPRKHAPAQPGALNSPGPAGTGAARQPGTVSANTGGGNPSPSAPSPASPTTPPPSPAPSPSPAGNGNCITLLGVRVCLHV